MAIWMAKAAVQKAITVLPERLHHPTNELFQRYVTKGTVLSERVLVSRLTTAAGHVAAAGGPGVGPVLELGSGWFPIVPLALHLCGVGPVTSVDLVSHQSVDRLREAATTILRLHDAGRLIEILPALQPERIAALGAALEGDGLDWPDIGLTLDVGDARHLPVPDGHYALIVSNHVLEHVDAEVLPAILLELQRVLAVGGVQSHLVDLSDHFSHLDRSITPYNFLRFSPGAWRRIDNGIQPQNRLRVDDYRALFADAGWSVTEELEESAGLDQLAKVRLHADYADRDPALLAVTTYTVRATA